MTKEISPHIISISGPSLSGKTELVKRMKDLGAIELVSHTTRPRRGNEVDGVHYNFVTLEEFEQLVKDGAMVQTSMHPEVNGHMYGMSAVEVNKQSLQNAPLLWVITPKSIPQIEQQIAKNADWTLTKVLVFNEPEVLVERLLERFKNDSESDNNNYAKRFLSLITKELPEWTTEQAQKNYDVVIKNFGADNEKEVLYQLVSDNSRINPTHPQFCANAIEKIYHSASKKNKMK